MSLSGLYLVALLSSISFDTIRCQNFMGMKPCPAVYSNFTDSIDELLGNWHITMLVMDKGEEDFEERSLCIQGRLVKINKTEIIQVWKLRLPEILRQDETEIDFPTAIVQPGVWVVQSPLGGEFRGTVLDTDGSSYLLITYCGWTSDQSAHMMTLMMSRSNIVKPKQRLQYLSILIKRGFDPFEERIVSWSDC